MPSLGATQFHPLPQGDSTGYLEGRMPSTATLKDQQEVLNYQTKDITITATIRKKTTTTTNT